MELVGWSYRWLLRDSYGRPDDGASPQCIGVFARAPPGRCQPVLDS